MSTQAPVVVPTPKIIVYRLSSSNGGASALEPEKVWENELGELKVCGLICGVPAIRYLNVTELSNAPELKLPAAI
jgi:hypothetical protein